MTRLMILSSEFPPGPGGIGEHAHQMAVYMSQKKWDVYVLANQDYSNSKEVDAFNRTQGFHIMSLPHTKFYLWNILKRWNMIQNLIKNWKPDVLVVTGDRQVWFLAAMNILKKGPFTSLRKIPWCAIWHGLIPPRTLERRMTSYAFSQPDLTITVSQYSLRQMLGMGVSPLRSLVITNGADEQRFSPDPNSGLVLREKLGLIDARILLTVGHVSNRKGQDIVIRALPYILQAIPNVHYLIAGIPTLQTKLEDLASELDVTEHVHFLGKVNKEMLPALYNACDVFVLVSRHSLDGSFEGYGIVAVEASLCGKPAVVADNSGLPEAIQHGKTGFVVPAENSSSVAQVVIKLFQDPSLCERMGEQAREHALAEQTWSASMAQYDKALSQLVTQKNNN